MNFDRSGRLCFGDFVFDVASGRLFREGRPVKIQPQPLRVLAVLLERPGEIVFREHLRTRVWGDSTFVEFDQGLNYCIRQIRLALRDGVSAPHYIETLPKQGYRFIAPVTVDPPALGMGASNQIVLEAAGPPPALPPAPEPKLSATYLAFGIFAVLSLGGGAMYSSLRIHPSGVKYTRLTDFTDSAVAPALSPDGRMVAFIRGKTSFLTADQIYVKLLPDGEARRLTDDPRLKYGLSFTPDGAEVAYTVLELPNWATYTVSVLGGDSHLFLNNAAGVTWLDPRLLLYSRTRSGQHMGIVTGSAAGQDLRELYFPAHERAMAHYSSASPDRRSALVVEMDQKGEWVSCRLISLDGRFPSRPIGPPGPCRSAAWSRDGSWMYFTVSVGGHSRLWRQRFSSGEPELITPGPIEADGIAVEQDGRSIITSMGVHESAIWIHDPNGEKSLSSEGEIVVADSWPSFDADGSVLYYLLRHGPDGSGPELWRTMVDSGKSDAVFPGVSMLAYDLSEDGKQVVYSTATPAGVSHLWLAAIDRSSPPRPIGGAGEMRPHFGPHGRILFEASEGNFNYLEQMNPDGSGRSKVVPYPISSLKGVSPGRRWVIAVVPEQGGAGMEYMAIPVAGGPPRIIHTRGSSPRWSSNGNFLVIPIDEPSLTSPGRSLAIPVGPGETLPEFPHAGIEPLANPGVIPGAAWIPRSDLIPGRDPAHFAYVNTSVHRNLYRISLP
jgi:DNA-binding winged helix-turn-helix (wHTH) protein/Tol biopolymer transport system component